MFNFLNYGKKIKNKNKFIFVYFFLFFLSLILVIFAFIFSNNPSFFKTEIYKNLNKSEQLFKLNPRANSRFFYKKNKSDFFNINNFYREKPFTVEIDIEPEFLNTLNASVPKVKGCKKIRYKKVPVKEVRINSKIIQGETWLRYRGFCYPHWLGKDKSMKIQLGSSYKGIKTLNLNTLATDVDVFDVWSGQLVAGSGGFASRVSIAQLYINGNYAGFRFAVENLDKDLLKNLDGPKGEIYREITHANLGHKDLKLNGQWQPYNSVNELKEVWKKNSKKNRPWEPFLDFQNKIYNGVLGKSDDWKNSININHYINYIAFQIITGTAHVNDHNIPLFIPTGKNRNAKIMPITYDFGGISGQSYGQFQGISQNWLTSLVWSDNVLRAKIHNRIIEILRNEKPYETYLKITDRLRTIMGKEFEVFSKETNDLKIVLRKRMQELLRRYLDPSFAISNNWKSLKKVQIFSDSLQPIDIIIDVDKNSCSYDDFDKIRVSINFSVKKQIISKCINGKYYLEPVRLDKLSSLGILNTKRRSHVLKSSPGGDLITIEGLFSTKLSSIKILNVNPVAKSPKKITDEINKFIPAYISFNQKNKTLKVLNNSNKELKISNHFELVDNKQYGTWKKINDKLFKAVINLPSQSNLICWEDTNLKKCFGARGKLTKKKTNNKIIKANKAPNNCKKNVVFSKGKWIFDKPVFYRQNCTIIFKAGATLYFKKNSFLQIEGNVNFPENGKVNFTALDKNSYWGGVVILNLKKVKVKNAVFQYSTEFVAEGINYTGALNIRNTMEVVVEDSIFKNNNSDDGLNIKGGTSIIRNNSFSKNRDAIDVDIGTSIIRHNIIKNSLDDGIDLGAADDVLIDENFIFSSGDKAVSVGEKSKVLISKNFIESNNMGIGSKDGSITKLYKNIFINNFVAVNSYKKSNLADNILPVKGQSYFFLNKTDYKSEGAELSSNINDNNFILDQIDKDKVDIRRLEIMKLFK